jgi:hypothetical protein
MFDIHHDVLAHERRRGFLAEAAADRRAAATHDSKPRRRQTALSLPGLPEWAALGLVAVLAVRVALGL